MKYQPKFKRNNPTCKEDEVICEISENLHQTMMASIRMNQDLTDNQIFGILRNAALSFSGQTIGGLLKLMTVQDQKFIFLKECQDIFNCYIQQALETIK
jgi:hypothetical protein